MLISTTVLDSYSDRRDTVFTSHIRHVYINCRFTAGNIEEAFNKSVSSNQYLLIFKESVFTGFQSVFSGHGFSCTGNQHLLIFKESVFTAFQGVSIHICSSIDWKARQYQLISDKSLFNHFKYSVYLLSFNKSVFNEQHKSVYSAQWFSRRQ
jgi:hypothetical protein